MPFILTVEDPTRPPVFPDSLYATAAKVSPSPFNQALDGSGDGCGNNRAMSRVGLTMKRSLLAGCALAAGVLSCHAAQAAEDATAVIKLMTSDIVVEANGASTHTVHVEVQATNDASARTVGQPALPYRESAQDLEIVEAYTQKASGEKLPVPASAIYTQQPQGAPQLRNVNDIRQKVVVFPNVGAGDTVVYTARWRTRQPTIPGHFIHTELFPRSVTYNEVRGTITAPNTLPLNFENHDVELRKEQAASTTSYHWRYSAPGSQTVRLPAVSPLDSIPRIFFSSLKGQEDLGRVYESLVTPAEAVTPKIQALANQLTAGLRERRQQAQTIYEWVSKNIRYVAVDIGNGGIVPHDAETTLTNGYGDCKDQAVLFAALLKAVGIESDIVLINLGNAYTIPEVATVTPFNHAITWIPELGIYADTTTGVAPFGTLAFPAYGKPVVHASASGPVVRRTPVVPQDAALMTLRTTARLDDDGSVTGDSTITAEGPFAHGLRALALGIQATGSARFAASLLEAEGLKGTGAIDVGTPTDLSPTYTLTSRFEYTDNRLVSGLGFGLIRGLSLTRPPGDGLVGLLFGAPQDDTQDTECHSGRSVEELVLELPADSPARVLPPNARIKTANVEFNATWSAAANTVTLRREFISTIDEPFCTGAVRRETAAALTQIRDHYERARISYRPSQTPTSGGGNTVASLVPRTRPTTSQAQPLAYFLAGEANAARGDHQGAVAEYTKAIRAKRDYKEALVNRGNAYISLREYDSAMDDFNAAIRLDTGDAAPYRGRASVHVTQARHREAAADLTTVIRLKPDDQLAYVNRAQAYLRTGRYERAIADCNTALQLGHDMPDCRRTSGMAHFVLAQHDEAIEDLTRATEMQPDSAFAFFQRGLAYLAVGQPQRAIPDLDNAVRLGTNDANAQFARGIARERSGDQAGANTDLAQALKVNQRVAVQLAIQGIYRERFMLGTDAAEICKASAPRSEHMRATIYCARAASDSNASPRNRAMAHFQMGDMYQLQTDYEEALDHYGRAVRLDPTLVEARVQIGTVHRLQNDHDRAIQSYDEAIKLAPFSAIAFGNRGIARHAKGQSEEALKDYSQAIALNPSYDTAFLYRASVYMERKQFQNAIVDYDRAIRLNPNVGVAYKGRCYALVSSGKPEQAMADCEKSVSLDPADSGAFGARGVVHLRLQNYPAAIKDYDAALAANPGQATSLYGRGVAKLKSGNAAEGNSDIAEAVKLDPNIASAMAGLGVTP